MLSNSGTVWMTLSAALLLQKNPVWQALLDDGEDRGAIVRDANAAELFPNMTELHLMQANRKAPALEPQQHPPARGGLPAGTNGQIQEPMGVSQAATGAGAGRGRARGGRGGRQGGPGRLPEGPGRGHVTNSVAGAGQVLQQAGPQQTLPSAQGTFAASVQQELLTPAQQAIQQGKLRQQQQQQQYRQHDQPVSAPHPLLQQQQQQQQQQPIGQRGIADQAAAQQPGSSMQGVQHSHWDTSYAGGAPKGPRDPRQIRVGQSHGGLQAGASQNLNRPPGPRPADLHPSGLVHQNSPSQLAADPVLGFGHQAAHHPSAGVGNATHAVGRSQWSKSEAMLQYPGTAPVREHGARPAMPAIPGVSGQQATHDHSVFGMDHLHVQQEQGGVDAPSQGQGPRYLEGDSIALDSLRQINAISASPHVMHMARAGDPGRAWQEQRAAFNIPVAPQAVQDTHFGRSDISSRQSETAPEVPHWTNNRR